MIELSPVAAREIERWSQSRRLRGSYLLNMELEFLTPKYGTKVPASQGLPPIVFDQLKINKE